MKTFSNNALLRLERGTIAPLAVVSVLVLFAVLAFSIDQGIACAAKIRQENALATTRDSCMDASFALVAKNDNNPGRAFAQHCMEALRSEGYEGAITVWFYEAPAANTPACKRVWGVGVQLYEKVPTAFARGYGIETLPVASKFVLVAEPYADTVVWRPLNSGNGCYQLEAWAKPSSLAFSGLNKLSDYPLELVQEVQEQINAGGHPVIQKGGNV